MLGSLQARLLLTSDAGFVGDDFARTILSTGCELLVRVVSNVKLLKELGYTRDSNGLVYVWTDKATHLHQPPLVFRLVVVK